MIYDRSWHRLLHPGYACRTAALGAMRALLLIVLSRMRNARNMIRLSGAMFIYSAVLMVLSRGPSVLDGWYFQGWVHVLLLVSLLYGFWRARSLSNTSGANSFGNFPLWLRLLAIPVAITVVSSWLPDTSTTHTTSTGAIVTKSSFYEDKGGYSRTENLGPPIKISEEEYRALERRSRLSFSRAWVLGWYLSIFLWYGIYLGDQSGNGLTMRNQANSKDGQIGSK